MSELSILWHTLQKQNKKPNKTKQKKKKRKKDAITYLILISLKKNYFLF